jgi:hypothetical protein
MWLFAICYLRIYQKISEICTLQNWHTKDICGFTMSPRIGGFGIGEQKKICLPTFALTRYDTTKILFLPKTCIFTLDALFHDYSV